jgi:hypothetical protein
MLKARAIAAGALIIMVVGVLGAQFGGRGLNLPNNEPPPTEFVFARWEYSSNGGWWHDYPDAEEHLNQVMDEATGVNVEKMSYRIVRIDSPEIFKYPFGYISEPGQMTLTDTEVKNFREFVDRGGFVMIDDFDGERQFNVMRENLERVFPDRQMFKMSDSHVILNTFYKIDSLYVESPYDVGEPAQFFGINNEQGNLAVIICFDNDVGDFWEMIDTPQYPVRPGFEVLRLGINFVLYSMTH